MPRPAHTTERQALLRKRLERFTRLLHGVEDGDANAVHRTRVASRRLREVLPVLSLEPDAAHKLRRRLRKITDRLGRVRELDVLHGTIRDLEKSSRCPKSALTRDTLRAAIHEALRSPRPSTPEVRA